VILVYSGPLGSTLIQSMVQSWMHSKPWLPSVHIPRSIPVIPVIVHFGVLSTPANDQLQLCFISVHGALLCCNLLQLLSMVNGPLQPKVHSIPVPSTFLSTVIEIHVSFQSTLQSSPLQYTFLSHGTFQSAVPTSLTTCALVVG